MRRRAGASRQLLQVEARVRNGDGDVPRSSEFLTCLVSSFYFYNS